MGAMCQTLSHPASPTVTVPREKQVGQQSPYSPESPMKNTSQPRLTRNTPTVSWPNKKRLQKRVRQINTKLAVSVLRGVQTIKL